MKTAAWSVPVIAVAVATPLAAASQLKNLDVSLVELGATFSDTVYLDFTAFNPESVSVTLQVLVPVFQSANISLGEIRDYGWDESNTPEGVLLTRTMFPNEQLEFTVDYHVTQRPIDMTITFIAMAPGYATATPTVAIKRSTN